MKKLLIILGIFNSSMLSAQQMSLIKAWEQSFASSSNYTFPVKLGYHRTVINGPHSVFQFSKTGNGTVAIRKYNETTGALENSVTYSISPSLGKNFFFDVPELNERKKKDDSTLPWMSFAKMALVATTGQNGNPHNKQNKKVIYFDPITFNILSQYSDSCAFINPPDSFRRATIFPIGGFADYYLFLQNYYVSITSGYQVYTAVCDTSNIGGPPPNPPQPISFEHYFSQHPAYLPSSQAGKQYWLTFDDSSDGGSLLWYSNYYDPNDPLKKSIMINPSTSGSGCFGPAMYEMSCDTCAVFEAEQIDRTWVREPIDTVVVVYKKQRNNWPLADYYLRFIHKSKDSKSICDSLSFYKEVLIASLPNQGFTISRCTDLHLTNNKLYIVIAQGNVAQVYCYDHNGNFLWSQQSLMEFNSTIASAVDNTGIYLGFKSAATSNPANHYQIVKYSESNGAIIMNYIDPTNPGMITDMKLNDWNSSIFVTGVNQANGYQTKTVRYNIGPTAVSDQSMEKIIVFPNPLGDQLTIEAAKELEGRRFTISDIFGRVVHEGAIRGVTSVSTKNFSSGNYFLLVSGITKPYKLVKQ